MLPLADSFSFITLPRDAGLLPPGVLPPIFDLTNPQKYLYTRVSALIWCN